MYTKLVYRGLSMPILLAAAAAMQLLAVSAFA